MRNNSTILHRLHLWYHDHPDQAAQYYKDSNQKWQPVSVRMFWTQVVRIAVYLKEQKLKRVVIFAANSPEWIHWEMGAWLAGGISIGIHPNTPKNDFIKMLEIAKADLVLVDTKDHSLLFDMKWN